jgi:uncharacterized protein YfaS (alpha-2-macroglobulin family)
MPNKTVLRPAAFALLAAASAGLPAYADTTPFLLEHVLMQPQAASPTACLRFSQDLSTDPSVHYGDYVVLSPDAKPSLTVTGSELCLGGLSYSTAYKLTLRAGLPGANGDKLAAAQTMDLALADRPGLVAISGNGYILSRDTTNGLAIETVNVTRLRIHVLRMSDKLLPWQLVGANGLQLNMQNIDEYSLHDDLQTTASLVWSGTMDVPEDHNRTVSTAFPIASLIPPGRDGLYLVVAEDDAHAHPEALYTDPNWQPGDNDNDTNLAAHWVVATDLALTSMNAADGLHVFARSLATGQPVSGAKIRLIATGLDTLGEQETDSTGAAVFPAALLAGRLANAPATLAGYGDNGSFAFQNLTTPAFDLSDRGVSGRTPPHDFQAFLYTERGIYRPGETVNVVTLLRDRVGDAVSNQPLKIVLRRPDGVADRSFVLSPADKGGFTQAITLSKTAARGNWTLEAYVDPTGAPVGQVQIDVEDFVPQQLKVNLASTETWLDPSQQLTASLDGSFLYGAPAAGLHTQGDLAIKRDDNPVPGADGYKFGLVDDTVSDIDNQLTLDDADDKGHLDISTNLPDLPQTTAPLKAVLSAGLLEPSGRYVGSEVDIPIRTLKLLLGIKPLFADGQVDENQPALFDIQTFDDTGKSVPTTGLNWTLVEEEPIFDWFQDNGTDWTWHFHTEDQQLASGSVDAPAGGKLNFSPSGFPDFDWGTYRLIVTDPASGATTSVRFNIGWNTAGGSASTPDKAIVTVDKALASPGDTVQLHIQGPFAGQAQVIIANDKVFSTQTVDVPKGGTTIPLTADASWGSGAYAVVTMVRPLSQGGPLQPVRALGLAWIGIDPAAHKLTVAVQAPAKITPRQTITVPVQVSGVASGDTPYVTLAGVDEGILQLTRFSTPDPLAFLFGKLALGLDIRDDYGNLLDGSADAGTIHTGGDDGLGGPSLPVESTRVVSLFSGRVQVGSDGVARIPVTVPDFEGQLRFMAVAYDNTQVGASDAATIVRDPVFPDVSLPRFLAPGDTARLAISLQNTDGVPGAYHLDLAVDGPASLAAFKGDYTLAAGQRLQDAVNISAKGIGIATINATLTGPNGYKVQRNWQIAIRSPHYPLNEQITAPQPAGTDFKLDPKLASAFLPGSASVSVSYAGFKGIDVPSLMQSLWLYPFGCTEQLSSSSFPLLYYKQPDVLLGSIGSQDEDFADTSAAGVHARVQQAIDTILDRQDATGEFGLWQVSDAEDSPWLNVYALDFLLHAKAAGFDVPDDAITSAYSHVHAIVRQIEAGANADTGVHADTSPNTETYAEYLLAQAGQGDIAILRRLHDNAVITADADGGKAQHVYWGPNPKDESTLAAPLALAQLSASLALMGDNSRATDAMQMAVQNLGVSDYPDWWFDDGYYSETRDLAGMIAIAANQNNASLAGTLLAKLNTLKVKPDDLNDQDKAWLLAAAAALNNQNATVNLTVNGQTEADTPLPAAFAPSTADITNGYDIRNDGPHDIWRTVTLTGAPAVAPPPVSAGFTLTKAYYTLDGKPLDPAHLRQNDRFIISLTGQSSDSADHRAVLVDMLPAGWEIEAPVRDDSANYTFLGALSKTRVEEARDDRFVAAFDLGNGWDTDQSQDDTSNDSSNAPQLDPGQFAVAYIVRVVTPGTFALPEAVVSDMYRPAEMARTAAGTTQEDPR